MNVRDYSLRIEGTVKSVFSETWEFLKPHMGYMTLIWAVFYIPTNIFILLRSGDMVKHMDSGSGIVLPVMLLLSLLGSIPNIVIVLLVGEGGSEDYNSLVGLAFRKIPYYITTTLAMALRIIPLVLSGALVSVLVSYLLGNGGAPEEVQIIVMFPVILLFTLYGMLRYSSAVPLYLVAGVRNFQAVRVSSHLYRMNRKKILAAVGICTFLPMALNFTMLFAVESEILNVILGFIIGYYMFLFSGFYAGFITRIQDGEDQEAPGPEESDGIQQIPEKSENR
ncbi:MAG: hypothetical protein PQJ58_09040 [Spirochaetales bacterium]|nr:hypothetical protein [Spirochaetales bacterium]